MPRDLSDVLDYFLPEVDPPARPRGAARLLALREPDRRRDRPAALPIVALPIADRDVVRQALAWNLAVEVARTGASAALVSPRTGDVATVWPEAGRGPLGTQVVLSDASDPGELARAALDVAVARAADADEGVVLVRLPPEWLGAAAGARALMRWILLFSSPELSDLRESYLLLKRLAHAAPEAELGLTIHGARRIGEAERAFARVAELAARHLGRELVSYGLLVDDLHVYRAIVARRPIGLEHPQSRAARALRDVAQLVLDDARRTALA